MIYTFIKSGVIGFPVKLRLAVLSALLSFGIASAQIFETTPFVSGTGGYNTYRIPAIAVTTNGTLLAFCEGRKNSSSDTGDIDLLLRRSADNGQSWSAPQVLWDDGGNTCGNPCVVVDRETGTVWLTSTWNKGSDTESEIINGTSDDTRRVYILSSDDDGLSWSAPAEITASVKQPDWTWYATGPGSGIQIERGAYAGRLIMPCDHIEAVTKRYYSHIFYSDDNGASWQLGGSTPQYQVNECEAVELADERIMLNMRNYNTANRNRQVAFSDDGGLSWYDQGFDLTLIEPICQAAVERYAWPVGDDPGIILFSNPASRTARTNMTVRASLDDGGTWPKSLVLHPGPSAYSDLAVLHDGRIACFFEKGSANPYQTITFAAFPVSALDGTGGADAPPAQLLAAWEFNPEDVDGVHVSATTAAVANTTGTLIADAIVAADALVLDGVGDYLQFGNDLDGLRSMTGMTLCAWIRCDDAGVTSRIVEHEDNFYFWKEGGRFRFTVHGSAGNVVSSSAPAPGEWQHVLVTCRAGLPARIYVNGSFESQSGVPMAQIPGNVQTFQIGARRSASGTTPTMLFDGLLDDVALWEGVLPPERIEALAGKFTGGYAGRVPPAAVDKIAFILSEPATGICRTNAVAVGRLLDSGFTPARVLLHWGAADGGTASNLWQFCVDLGEREAGEFQMGLAGLAPAEQYFYRFRSVVGEVEYWATNSVRFTTLQYLPDEIPGLKLWLRSDRGVCRDTNGTAAVDGDIVARWNDLSGGGHHAVRIGSSGNLVQRGSVGSALPLVSVTDIDGGDYLRVPTFTVADTDDLTVFVVARSAPQTLNGSAIHPLVGSGDPGYGKSAFTISTTRPDAGGSAVLGYFGRYYNPFPYDEYTKAGDNPNFSDGDLHIIELRLDDAATGGVGRFAGHYDGVAKETHAGVSSNPLNGPVEIGGSSTSGSRRFAGAFAEILIYGRALDHYERNRVGRYLQQRYGLNGGYVRVSNATTLLLR